RAPADGYTLLQVATTHAINVALYERNTVTVTRDIVPIASTNRDFFVLLVNPSFPAKTIAEFIAYAKGQSRQDQHSFERHCKPDPPCRRAVPNDDRHRNCARSLSWYTGGAIGADSRRRACGV